MSTVSLKSGKKVGRPRIYKSETTTVGVNLSEETRELLTELAEARNIKLSAICRELIMEALERRVQIEKEEK